ncbi:MAG: branched-chain amino acid ABC transporter substrate-binding protein [Acidimicrobiales bacterium]
MQLRLNKTVATVASGALLLMAVPAIGLASTSGAAVKAKPTYTIGYEGPLSGSSPQLGLNMLYAVELAINQANATGKLPFKLRFAKFDDQGSATLSPSQAQAAVNNRSLVAIVGPAYSGATKSAEPYYSAAHIATVSPSATAAGLAFGNHNNFMRVVAGDDVQGAADANFLVKTKGAKSIDVINDGGFYGAGLASVVAASAKKAGASVTTYTYPGTGQCQNGTASSSQYTAAATQIVAGGAKAVFYGGYYCDFGLLLGALSSANYKGTIMSGDGSWSTALIAGTTPATAANGVYLSEAGGGNANLTGILAKKYQALSHFSANGATYAAQSYDATNMIIQALKTMKRSTNIKILRPALVNRLHAMTFHGVTGVIKFQGNGDLTRSSIVDFGQVQNGQIVPVSHT